MVHNGVTILGTLNLAGKLAGNASPLFAKNLANFLDLLIAKDGTLKVDFDDEIIKGDIDRQGRRSLVHPRCSLRYFEEACRTMEQMAHSVDPFISLLGHFRSGGVSSAITWSGT